jgi:hypothetical protein
MHLPSGASFEGKEFKVVARMLLDAPPYHVFPWNKLAEAAGEKGYEGRSC